MTSSYALAESSRSFFVLNKRNKLGSGVPVDIFSERQHKGTVLAHTGNSLSVCHCRFLRKESGDVTRVRYRHRAVSLKLSDLSEKKD